MAMPATASSPVPTEETFTLLPLSLDPSTKAISTLSSSSSSADPTLTNTLTQLNSLHRTLLSMNNPTPFSNSTTPPPPSLPPTNPKRSSAIAKMRDQALSAMKKHNANPNTKNNPGSSSSLEESLKYWTYAIDMAIQRPGFEASAVVREELASLYASRAQVYMMLKRWAEGFADGKCSVECKRQGGNKEGWVRGARCLVEMGRWEEGGRWIEEGKGTEGAELLGREWEEVGREVEVGRRRWLEREGRAE